MVFCNTMATGPRSRTQCDGLEPQALPESWIPATCGVRLSHNIRKKKTRELLQMLRMMNKINRMVMPCFLSLSLSFFGCTDEVWLKLSALFNFQSGPFHWFSDSYSGDSHLHHETYEAKSKRSRPRTSPVNCITCRTAR